MAKLEAVFGDHPHLDTGEDQTGGVADDEAWQEQWRQLIALTPRYYNLLSGKYDKRFANLLAHEVDLTVEKKLNSKRWLAFQVVIMQRNPDYPSTGKTQFLMGKRMDC